MPDKTKSEREEVRYEQDSVALTAVTGEDTPEERAEAFARYNLRDAGSIGVLTGYAAVFNRSSVDLGGFTEEIDSSAFASVLGDDVRGVVDHDSARILGRTTAKTMQVGTDERGLWYAIAVPDTAVGRDILTSVRRGDITGSSFKFWTEDDTWAMRNGIAHRTILRVKRLLDVGPVTFPAYPDSTAEAQRSLASWKESAASSSGAEVGYDERWMKQREAETRG